MDRDEIDFRMLHENVSFLDYCFDNSFTLKSSLIEVKEYISQQKDQVNDISTSTKLNIKKKHSLDCSLLNVSTVADDNFRKDLKNWGLPMTIVKQYEQKGISRMFKWQADCLSNSKVLLHCCNLIYSAPTSAGKTLVAEILAVKTILERQKKVIIILPYVSIVREKMFYLQQIFSSSGIRVEGFMGSQSPPGGLQSVHIALCTIEKANSLVNKMLDDNSIFDLGAVIVDELHLLGDPHRGYILELLLTKVKYFTNKTDDINIQIIGMSATLPNLEVLANWLDAELFITDFRPIPLDECCLVDNKLYDNLGNFIQNMTFMSENKDCDSVLNICLETIKEGCSVLIFCMTKNRCENLAQNIASSFFRLGSNDQEIGPMLREQLRSDLISEVLEQLKNCPVKLDQLLKNVISFGVAFHHAGLTYDERDIIEGAFKSGALRVLVATSTLSSGVNLPARKVIIRSPVFQRQPINILTYKQMVGRAGRLGKDTKGESILICTKAEQKIGFNLMMGNLDPVKSCIESEDKFMRAVLEMIASQVVCVKSDLILYSKCTLLFNQQHDLTIQNSLLENTLKQLIDFELVRVQSINSEENYVATSLGKACLSSSMAPNDGLSLFCELQKARQCIVLETDLHLIYLVTPYSVSSQWADLDWLHLLTLWESLTLAMKRVGQLVGVQESFIIRCLRGGSKSVCQKKINIHKRFYTALALQDLVNEVPLSDVATKFQCARGFLQGLQQAAATFAGMVTAFCRQLGWKNMELLISQFQDRLHFGVQSELLELMKLTSLNSVRARTLFNMGFETITSIASANVNEIENALHKAAPFQSEKGMEGDDDADIRKRNKMRNIWITGFCGMTAKEAADNLILEARKYLEFEIGVVEIKWDNKLLRAGENSGKSDCKELQPEFQLKCDIACDPKNEDSVCIDNKTNLQHVKSHSIALKVEEDNSPCSNLNEGKESVPRCNNEITIGKSLVLIEPDTAWDSLQVNETALNNISKIRLPPKEFSPNISFGDFEDNIELSNTAHIIKSCDAKSIKDVSIFSSEGDNSSLFEDSLPLDLIPNTVIDSRIESKYDNNGIHETEFLNLNSTAVNTSKSPNFDDKDMPINFVDVNDKVNDKTQFEELNINPAISQDIDEISTQRDSSELLVKKDFISPLKRSYDTEIKNIHGREFQRKRSKTSQSKSILQFKLIPNKRTLYLKSSNSMFFNVQVNNEIFECYVLRENDIVDSLNIFSTVKMASLIFLNNMAVAPSRTIGGNIIKEESSDVEVTKPSIVSARSGIAIYLQNKLCLYLDLSSLSNLCHFTSKFMKCLSTPLLNISSLSVKTQYLNLRKLVQVQLSKIFADIFVSEWLIQNEESTPSVRELTKKYLNMDLLTTKAFINNIEKSSEDMDKIEESCIKAWSVYNIAKEQEKIMFDKYQFTQNVVNVENQVLKILAYTEYQGIMVDKELASQLLIDVKSSQEILQKKAYRMCGYHFNFNSSNDVAKVLGIYRGRKVSTKKSVLTSHNSPMASIVIYWRKLNSILTKTLYPLTEKAYMYSTGNRINPSYTMFTCTGRISMHEPNLQNVPRTFSVPLKYLSIDDTEPCDDLMEFNCRNIFKASPGTVFVSADYCQLEVRILTHYSKDVVLSRIMASDVDVFKSIAASWGGIPETEVDDDLRQKAKQLCYGILYGMGNRTLSKHLDVSEIEAAVFMDSFYKTYPAVRVFTQNLIEECRSKGYVETLMKRRRYLPDINSHVYSKRTTAERQAVNTTIQGSAADIAKAAMCAIDDKTYGDAQPYLILQMHDELIYEVQENKKSAFIKILKEVMETTIRLSVPLPVKVKSGYTWGSLKEVNI